MDVCSSRGMSVSEDLKNLQDFNNLVMYCKLSADPEFTCKIAEDFSLNDLGSCLSESLTIRDDQKRKPRSVEPSDDKGISKIEKDDISRDSNLSEFASMGSENCMTKCATFPCSSKVVSFAGSIDGHDDGKDDLTAEVLAQNDHTKSAKQPYQCSISLPAPLKLVSAMKGSRQKLGASPRKLTVTWAPDVYDPPPSAALHVSTGKILRHKTNSKKNVKNKHKMGGKSSRSSRGKDKKQTWKYGGNSNRFLKLMEGEDRMVDCNKPHDNLVDFDVSSQDPFCGSSFLGKPVMKLQFPIA